MRARTSIVGSASHQQRLAYSHTARARGPGEKGEIVLRIGRQSSAVHKVARSLEIAVDDFVRELRRLNLASGFQLCVLVDFSSRLAIKVTAGLLVHRPSGADGVKVRNLKRQEWVSAVELRVDRPLQRSSLLWRRALEERAAHPSGYVHGSNVFVAVGFVIGVEERVGGPAVEPDPLVTPGPGL
jgi:hypothetical protein